MNKTALNQHDMRKDNLKQQPLSRKNSQIEKEAKILHSPYQQKSKINHLSSYFGNYKLWKLRGPKIELKPADDGKEAERLRRAALLSKRLMKKNVSDVNLVQALTDEKLDDIFSFLSTKTVVSKEDFFKNTLDILGHNKTNLEILESAYEMVDLEDTGEIKLADFVDFLFEQGISKTVKPGFFNFEHRKELRIRSIGILVYESINILGVQEKYTFKYYLIKLNNYSTIGIVNIPKDVKVLHTIYLHDYHEILLFLSDKTVSFIDRKDYTLRRTIKLPESISEVQYIQKLKILLTLTISGELQTWNMAEYFSQSCKRNEKSGVLNYRMILIDKVPGYNEELFKNCSSFLWVEYEQILLIAYKDFAIYNLQQNSAFEFYLKVVLTNHTALIKKMKFSNKTKYVYSVSINNVINVWNPFVKKPLSSINAFKDIEKIVVDVFIPEKNNVIVGLTETNSLVIWDMLNLAKVCQKNYSLKSQLTLFDTKPFLITGGAAINISEYGTQINKKKIYLSAMIYSHKYNILYVAMKYRIISYNAISWKQINNRYLDDVDKVTKMVFSQNEKHIVCTTFNGRIAILHAFTLEVQLTAKTIEAHCKALKFFEKENTVVEAYQESLRYMTYDYRHNSYECTSTTTFLEPHMLKAYDMMHNFWVVGLSSGYVVFGRVKHGGIMETTSFKASDKHIDFVKIIYEDFAIIIGDSHGRNYYIRLNYSRNYTSSSKLRLFNDFEAYRLENATWDTENTQIDNFYYQYNSFLGMVDIWFTSRTGNLYRYQIAVDDEQKVYPMNIQYLKALNTKFSTDYVQEHRNSELEDAQQYPESISPKSCKLSDSKMRFITIVDKKDLLAVTKKKSIKLWNIESCLFKEDIDSFVTEQQDVIPAKPKPYFKVNFLDLGDLNFNNQIQAKKLERKETQYKNYTKRQLSKLGDDMKSMISDLDKIEKLLPKNEETSRAQSRMGSTRSRYSSYNSTKSKNLDASFTSVQDLTDISNLKCLRKKKVGNQFKISTSHLH